MKLYGRKGCGLKSCGLKSCGLKSYGLKSYGLKSCGAIALGLSLIFATAKPVPANPHRVTPVGWILEATGNVPIKPRGARDYYRVSVGTPLPRGTIIFPTSQMSVKILCADRRTYWLVPSGVPSGVGNGCPPLGERPDATRTTGGICSSPQSPRLPYIISPRSTFLLSAKPILRWNPVADATLYIVSVSKKSGEILWKTTVRDTEVAYNGEPSLEPGVEYELTVEAKFGANADGTAGASSREENLPPGNGHISGFVFEVLPEQKAAEVRDAIALLQEQELTETAKTLALARVYSDSRYNLRAEAISLLEAAISRGIETTATYYLLGDLYCQVGLTSFAERHYLRGIEQGTTERDFAARAALHARLGQLYYSSRSDEKARRHWQQALYGYIALQDMEQVAQIQRELERF